MCEHTELWYLKRQVAVCKQEQGVADLADDTAMALGFGESGREDKVPSECRREKNEQEFQAAWKLHGL